MFTLSNLSPKAVVAFLLPAVAAALLWLITGNSDYLIGILAGVVAGGGAIAAPPAVGVSHAEVVDLAESKKVKPKR